MRSPVRPRLIVHDPIVPVERVRATPSLLSPLLPGRGLGELFSMGTMNDLATEATCR
jgi:hypothetical protein